MSKAKFHLTILLSMLPFVTGCAGCANNWSKIKAGTVGLNRTITLYKADGGVIEQWKTTHPIELHGGDAWFVASDGTQTTVSGTFIIEEK